MFDQLFDQCCFLIGKDKSVMIVVPTYLPDAETYTVAVTDQRIRFKAGHDNIAELDYKDSDGEIYHSMMKSVQVGLLEYPPGDEFPQHISKLAYVEVRRAM